MKEIIKRFYWKVIWLVGLFLLSPIVAWAGEETKLTTFLQNILRILQACAGITAVILLILGGIQYASKGESASSTATQSGKGKIVAAIALGLLVVAAQAIITIVQGLWPG